MSKKTISPDSSSNTSESFNENDLRDHHPVEIIIGGFLYKKGWEKWSKRWFLLYEDGIMLYFKKAGATNPSGFIDFNDLLTIEACQHDKERYTAFTTRVISQSNEITHYFASDSADMINLWAQHIVSVGSTEAEVLLGIRQVKDFNMKNVPKRKRFARYTDIEVSSYFSRGYKKNIGRSIIKKIAKSNVGKSALKNVVSQDGFLLIEVLGTIIEAIKGEGESKIWEEKIIMLGAEVSYFIQDKEIEKESLMSVREPIFKLWSDCLDMLELSFAYDKHRLQKAWRLVTTKIIEMLQHHQTEEKLMIIQEYGDFFSNKNTIHRVYRSDEFEEIRNILRTILRRAWEETFYRGLD